MLDSKHKKNSSISWGVCGSWGIRTSLARSLICRKLQSCKSDGVPKSMPFSVEFHLEH